MEQRAINFGKTFEQAFLEWKASQEQSTLPDTTLVKAFAAWLDTTKFLTPQLQVLALLQARKIDSELINDLIEVVGKEKATEIARGIQARYQKV